ELLAAEARDLRVWRGPPGDGLGPLSRPVLRGGSLLRPLRPGSGADPSLGDHCPRGGHRGAGGGGHLRGDPDARGGLGGAQGGAGMGVKEIRTVDDTGNFEHPLYRTLLSVPGLTVATTVLDHVLTWGMTNALWTFPMATSCCGIEFMATAASRVDIDRMGTIVRATPRQADVMVVAGTITVKMAPRVKKLWDQMPEPKWCIAMGSCAISGDFYRNLYSVVPGVDTFLPVDVYVPGCPPNPEALMHGFLRLQEKIRAGRRGENVTPEPNPELLRITRPS